MEQKGENPGWQISTLYEQAWAIVKQHKILWIFGMLAGSAGANFNSFSNLGDLGGAGTQEKTESASNVLGAATSSAADLFALIPTWMYAILGIEILLLISGMVVFMLVYSAWANAALLEGIQSAITKEPVTIRSSSEKAFRSIKSLIWLTLVPSLLFTLALLFLFGALIGAFLLVSGGMKWLIGFLMVVATIGTIWAAIMLTLTLIWAPRVVVIDQQSALHAFKRGYHLARKKFWSMVILGIVNMILGVLVFIVPLIVVGMVGIALFTGGYFAGEDNPGILVLLIGFGIIVFIITIVGYIFLGGIWTAFKTAVWNLAYMTIRKAYE